MFLKIKLIVCFLFFGCLCVFVRMFSNVSWVFFQNKNTHTHTKKIHNPTKTHTINFFFETTEHKKKNTGGGNDAPIVFGDNVKRGFEAVPQMKIKLGAYPRSHQTDQFLASNQNLQISYFTVHKQQQSVIALFASNLNANNSINNITITVQCQHASLQTGFDASNSLPAPKLLNARTASIASIDSNATICQLISLGAISPQTVETPTLIIGNVTTNINNNKDTLNFKITINMSDILRPCAITTEQFGQNWVNLGASYLFF